MIAGTGFEKKKNEPTRFPRGTGSIEHGINRYVNIYIGHDSSVWVCFPSKRSRIASAMMVFEAPGSALSRKVGGSVTF